MDIATAHRLRYFQSTIIFGVWTLIGLLLATQAWFSNAMHGERVAWWAPMTTWLVWAYIWALFTPLALKLAKAFPFEKRRLLAPALVHMMAALLFAGANLAVFATMAPYIGSINVGHNWGETFSRLFGTAFLLNIPVYGVIIATAYSLQLSKSIRDRERRELQLETQLADARLLALRAQLQPHFLFNTLNSVSVLMREDVDKADQILLLLSDLLRRAIDTFAPQKIKLSEEISFLEAYVTIEKIRFEGRLTYNIDIDQRLLDALVPSLILQPLVENAVRHGLEKRASRGHILIAARQIDQMLHLTVQDNGVGLSWETTEGVGLSNTRARLKLLYGDDQSFEITNIQDGGLLATVIFPLQRGDRK